MGQAEAELEAAVHDGADAKLLDTSQLSAEAAIALANGLVEARLG